MNIKEDQLEQNEEEEIEDKYINNKKSSLKEEGKINNFSFGKKNNKNSDEYKNNEEINLKDKDKYTNLKPYLANNNNQYNNIHFINNLDENNLDSEYSTPNDEADELDDEEFDNSNIESETQNDLYDTEKNSNKEFPNIINLFKEDSNHAEKELESQKRIMEITEAFNLFDKDCDGNIDIKELVTVMRTLGYDPDKQELEDIIKTFDVDKSGTIDKDEFINLLTTKIKEQKDDKDLLEIFNMFDKDRDGLICETDINYIIDEIGEEFDIQIVKELITLGDDDKDGKINFIEFKKIFTKN